MKHFRLRVILSVLLAAGFVVAFSVERETGVDVFKYSQQDNEGMGARFNEDSKIEFGFEGGEGKIWVDLERSTKSKLYCYEYLCDLSALYANGEASPIGDHITLVCREFTKTRKEISDMNLAKGEKSFIKEEKTVKIPVADKLNSKTFKSANGGTVKLYVSTYNDAVKLCEKLGLSTSCIKEVHGAK